MILLLLIIFVTFNFEFSNPLILNKNNEVEINYRRSPRHNAKDNSYRWLDATVPYKIDMTNYSKFHSLIIFANL